MRLSCSEINVRRLRGHKKAHVKGQASRGFMVSHQGRSPHLHLLMNTFSLRGSSDEPFVDEGGVISSRS